MKKPIRQSSRWPSRLAQRVRALAKQRTSANRVLVELMRLAGIERKPEKRRFFEWQTN